VSAAARIGQGATEYLVLLAVVLIVALVSVALLGFFPGMATDAQMAQSQTYWQSASPIAITEWGARLVGDVGNYTQFYMRIRNTGSYPIRLSKVLANGRNSATMCTGSWGCAGAYTSVYLFPGEERIFGHPSYFTGIPDAGVGNRSFFVLDFQMTGGTVTANCSTAPPYGTAVINGFGFEYTQYVDGQQLTKREIGTEPVVIRCLSNI
jgi:hypothetical protein